MSELNVLFVGAHPDDEIMVGGILAALSAHGAHTTVVCATDGRGGEDGGVPEAAEPEARARVREAELRCSVRALGVHELILFGYEDPAIGPNEELYPYTDDEETLVTRIVDVIRQTGANVVLTHGSDGEYGHPAHVQTHRAVLRAVQEHAPHVLLYTIHAYVPNLDTRSWNVHDPAHLMLDITPWFEQKYAAMLCHRTQHPLFLRHRNLDNVRQAVRSVEAVRRYHPPVPEGEAPQDAFAEALLKLGAQRVPSVGEA